MTPQHLLRAGLFDPEGAFSTLPAIVTVLAGYFTGEWLRDRPRKTSTSVQMLVVGLSCLVIGCFWDFVFPLNKQLWTSSYVVFSAGWALLLLAVCYEAIEVRCWRHWGWPFQVMGLNAICVLVASGFVARILLKTHMGTDEDAPNTYSWLYQNWFVPWTGQMNGSVAIANLFFWWVILYVMYRRRWFFKL